MEVNDISPKTDQIERPSDADGEDRELNDIDDDIHVCRKCNLEFKGIQKYLEHKIKHDNFRVKFGRSEVDRRMIMPMLVQKGKRKPLQETIKEPEVLEEEKENDVLKKKVKRGRKRASEIHDQGLVITEKPVYTCEKCHKKFNREATLRRHIQYDHNEDDLDEEDEGLLDDDRDRDYKPTETEIQEEEMKDQAEDATAEMDSLDQVIMAAEMMEKAEESSSLVTQTVSITTDSGQVIRGTITQHLNKSAGLNNGGAPEQNGAYVASPFKRQKLTDEEKALRKFSCFLCGNKFKDLNVLKSHMITHNEKREFVCTFEDCPYSFKTKGSLKRHLRRHTGERPYPCELCGRNFAESGALTRHLKSRTPCTSKSDNDLPRYGKKWTYTPNIPAVSLTKKSIIEKAQENNSEANMGEINKDSMIQEVSEVTLPIDDGGAMSTVVHVLEDTIHEDQGEEYYNIVDDGGVEIVIAGTDDVISDDSIGQFVQTETDITDSVSNVCRVCGEDLASVEGLKIHLRTHLADQACRCWLCHFNTENRETFENHMFMHHHVQIKNSDPLLDLMPLEPDIKDPVGDNKGKEKRDTYKDAQIAVKQLMEIPDDAKTPQDTEAGSRLLYKCPICMRKFRGSNYLKLHMRNHTGIRPHKCAECDKSFITKDTLNKHMSSHAEERNFKCGECGKLFKRLSHVREHLKIHTGLRPFPCTICSKSFKTNNAMKVHLRTHSDILPYECTFCHRRFREKGSVLRHTRMHTGEKPYECMYCGRGFAEHGTLNRHLKAKVSCTNQLQELRDKCPDDEDTDYTVLAEFSSVVADTQQYIIPEGEVDSGQIQETLVQDDLLETDGEIQLDQNDEGQETKYVLVETADEDQVQNLEIVTSEEGQSLIQGVQVTEDYIMISELDDSNMKIVDSKTGQVIALVPVAISGEGGSEIHTITLPQDGVISTVDIDTEMDVPTETVTSMVEYIETDNMESDVIVDGSKVLEENVQNTDVNVTLVQNTDVQTTDLHVTHLQNTDIQTTGVNVTHLQNTDVQGLNKDQ